MIRGADAQTDHMALVSTGRPELDLSSFGHRDTRAFGSLGKL
jgi:hypothetical protein